MFVDGGKLESLHNFRCWTEERDRPIRSLDLRYLPHTNTCQKADIHKVQQD